MTISTTPIVEFFAFLLVVVLVYICIAIIFTLPKWFFRDSAESKLWELRDRVYDYQSDGTLPSQNVMVKKFIQNLETYTKEISKLSISKLFIIKLQLSRLSEVDFRKLSNKCMNLEIFISMDFSISEMHEMAKCIEERNRILLRAVRFGSWTGIFMQIRKSDKTARLVEENIHYWLEWRIRMEQFMESYV